MAYEYLYPHVEKLKDKPFRADEVIKVVEKAGFNPIAVRVDNTLGSVFVYFERELNAKEKEKLDEAIEKMFKEWR